jgi:hypothetical protein
VFYLTRVFFIVPLQREPCEHWRRHVTAIKLREQIRRRLSDEQAVARSQAKTDKPFVVPEENDRAIGLADHRSSSRSMR